MYIRLDCTTCSSNPLSDTGLRWLIGVFSIKLGHQAAHPLLHVTDGVEHVGLELRIVLVPLGIAQHQGHLGHQVFQIMHHEGRHAIEGIELAGLDERLSGLHAGKVAGRLPTRHLQQIEHFPVYITWGCAASAG
jgi:hypothetical protein